MIKAPKETETETLTTDAKNKILNKALLIFTPTIIVIIIACVAIILNQEKLEIEVYQHTEKTIVDAKLKSINDQLSHVLSDLSTLKSNSLIKNIWDNNNSDYIETLSKDFADFVHYQKKYDQVRLLDLNGMEIIRINFNNGKTTIVPDDKLQNKKNRYYFQEAITLNKDEFFASPFDLNVENDSIEKPIKPVIRFATPVFDNNGKKQGILIFNYLGKNILDLVDLYSNPKFSSQPMLLNTEAYWIKSPFPEKDWAFIFKDRNHLKFSYNYPDAWNNIINQDSIQLINKNGLFTSQTIYPLMPNNTLNIGNVGQFQKSHKNYSWKIVSFIPYQELYGKQHTRRYIIISLLTLFAIGLFYFSWRFSKAQYLKLKAIDALKISNTTKDKFFSIIAHDLRGSFNALLGLSDLMVTDINSGVTNEIKNYGEMINSTINSTHGLLNNLLDWSRSQTNQMNFKQETFNLFSLVLEIFEFLKFQSELKHIALKNFVPMDLDIYADRNMLNTVIRNIVSNAIKYSNKNGSVTISALIDNNNIRCAITDDGVGMSKETCDRLFNVKDIKLISKKGTNDEHGTGLGLILCRELIEKHNGSIGVDSIEGKGSTFWFEIPIIKPPKNDTN
ncbi:sensor histidine kinase [Snuella lapsa]|uniref:histidine kinase n=1 Tax=Snuella lapsa TaxID=870481 RepID=A0ABP6Y173_9FLAO